MLVSKPFREETERNTNTTTDGEDRFDLVFNPCNANFARFVVTLLSQALLTLAVYVR